LLRRRRKHRQFVDVARVVLDDHGRFEVRRDLLDALERCHGLGAIEVERRHAVAIEILAEVRGVAGDHHIARLRQLDEQAMVTRRVARRSEHDNAAFAEHILV
jgi:hypothetical protein